jgi:hypothetical protein
VFSNHISLMKLSLAIIYKKINQESSENYMNPFNEKGIKLWICIKNILISLEQSVPFGI